MAHELLDPIYSEDLDPGYVLEKYSCECGKWQRLHRLENSPRIQEIQSEHEQHRRLAGAEELRTGTPPKVPEVSLESLARAMAKFAEAAVKSAEAMKEFNEAYAAAEERGIGVIVVRHPDGSTTSTPNVFIPAGTAVFSELPGIAMPIPPFPSFLERNPECQKNSSESPTLTTEPAAA